MIVSIGIFLTALTMIFGALVSINNAARKTRSAHVASDNLGAAIDAMSRNMRVGGDFHCGCGGTLTTPQNCPMTDALGNGGDVCVAFEGQQGDSLNPNDQIIYRFSGNSIERSTDSGATYLPLTAPELTITSLKFFVYGAAAGEDQPTVTMVIRGTASTTARTSTTFNMQTSVSAYTPNF
jgi:hypothetical protein